MQLLRNAIKYDISPAFQIGESRRIHAQVYGVLANSSVQFRFSLIRDAYGRLLNPVVLNTFTAAGHFSATIEPGWVDFYVNDGDGSTLVNALVSNA